MQSTTTYKWLDGKLMQLNLSQCANRSPSYNSNIKMEPFLLIGIGGHNMLLYSTRIIYYLLSIISIQILGIIQSHNSIGREFLLH